MIAGIALLLLTGLCWVGIAVTVSMAAERRLDMGYIMFAAGLIISAVTVPLHPLFAGHDRQSGPADWAVLLVLLAGAGSVGYPVAQGSCIAFFILYEKFVRRRPCRFPHGARSSR